VETLLRRHYGLSKIGGCRLRRPYPYQGSAAFRVTARASASRKLSNRGCAASTLILGIFVDLIRARTPEFRRLAQSMVGTSFARMILSSRVNSVAP
jgi:hypothetical protein